VWSAKISQRDNWILDDLQALCAINGYSAKKTGPHTSTTGGVYSTLDITKRTERHVTLGTGLESIPYKGIVWCVTVPNGTIFTRYKGTTVVLVNCRPPWCPFTFVCYPDWKREKEGIREIGDLIHTVARRQELKMMVDEATSELDELSKDLKAALVDGIYPAGEWTVKLSTRRTERIDTKAVRAKVDPLILPSLFKVTEQRYLDVKAIDEEE
jgi:hypothetical protein